MKKILIVDDDDDIRKFMKIVLEKESFEIFEANNGSTALDIARERLPDLIISDVMMENMNGFMLYELLRDEGRTAKIPMILVTGAAQQAGAWDSDPHVKYLQKPLSIPDFLSAVKEQLK
jgi:CheY-like chemotaxis protein